MFMTRSQHNEIRLITRPLLELVSSKVNTRGVCLPDLNMLVVLTKICTTLEDSLPVGVVDRSVHSVSKSRHYNRLQRPNPQAYGDVLQASQSPENN
jgi:hypothetical protein